MKPIYKHFFLLLILLNSQESIWTQDRVCDFVIKGKVFDLVTKEPLAFATVLIEETGQGVVVDPNGEFIFEEICDDEIHLEIRFVGYKTTVHHHDFYHEDPIIYLAPDETLLESVVVEGSRLNAFQSLAIQRLEVKKIALLSTSIGELTEQMSGVSILKTGANIAKPIVHGLHSNRVLVMNDGLRHGYQLWADEHAPEIDPSHVNEIEIVKGAGTVKYGPEALGGVILYNSKRALLDQKLGGSVGSSYQTNGKAYSTQLSLEQGSHRFAWNASGFGIRQADLRAPDYNLSNTGKREYGGSFNTLFHHPQFELVVSGSYLDQELGILRGAIVGNLQDLQNAIERSTPSPTFEPTYTIQNPRQETQHGLLKTNLSLFLGDHLIRIQYGIQRNFRREFDVRRGELNRRPVIDLKLLSHTFEAEWVQPENGAWRGSSGVQVFSQQSVNKPGTNSINFVPDYDVFNVGAYSVQSLDFEESTLELGLRLDYQTLSVVDTIREVTIYSNDVSFTNATFTLGYKNRLSENISLFTNIGTAWRPPNVSELYSFGYYFSRIQFGLWRYNLNPQITTPLDRVFDESDRPVNSERSLKWVAGLEVNKERLNAEFIIHANRIHDYIFLRPFGITTNVAGTFPYFIFDQTNALFLGSDWDIQFQHNDHITSEARLSYVYALETENDQPFIEIPPMNVNYTVTYAKGPWEGGISIDYMAEQWNAPIVIEPASFQHGGVEINPSEIFDFMPAPKDYLLFGARVAFEHRSFNAELKIDNLLNSSYRPYTDRLRYFADAPGRNLSITVGIQF